MAKPVEQEEARWRKSAIDERKSLCAAKYALILTKSG
jgi:hypothetical protein